MIQGFVINPWRTVRQFCLLARLHKPIGIALLLWPTYWALWLASNGWPATVWLAVFGAGCVVMRSAGCVINDLADRHIDTHVKRTQARPLASGMLSAQAALIGLALLCSLALGLAALLPPLAQCLALPGFALACLYPFCKRCIPCPQAVLGLAFSWGIPMAFAAVLHHIPAVGWALYGLSALWAIIYDTWYALMDKPDDIQIGVHSSAIWFGRHDHLIIGLCQAIFCLGCAMLPLLTPLHWPYQLSIAGVAGLFCWQHRLARTRRTAGYQHAFIHNHWVGLTLLIGIHAGLA